MLNKKFTHYTESFIYYLEQTAIYCRENGKKLFQELSIPLSLDEYIVIDTLSIHPGICQIELAKLILKDRVFTSRLLNSLEQKGYVLRQNMTKDNRLVKIIYNTDKAKDVLNQYQSKLEEQSLEVFKDLSDEDIENIQESLTRLRNSLNKYVAMKF